MKLRFQAVIVTIILAALPGILSAQQKQEPQTEHQETVPKADLYRTSNLTDFEIQNEVGEDIGFVRDLVIGPDRMITHLITDLDDIEGLETGTYLVPLDLISRIEEDAAVIDTQRIGDIEQLTTSAPATLPGAPRQPGPGVPPGSPAPPTTPGNDPLPPVAGPERPGVPTVPGTRRDGIAAQLPEGSIRISDLMVYNVLGADGEDIGNVEDFVVNIRSGRIVSLVLGAGGFLGIDREQYEIPFGEVEIDPQKVAVRVPFTERELDVMEEG